MKLLNVAPELRLDAAQTTTQTLVVYGGKGMGKTNLGAVLCEELAAAGKRFCFIDPVGVAWGLRHSADGKGQGLDIRILGGRHGDVAIEPTGGAVVADFVAGAPENILIDISCRADGRRWSNPEKIRFVGDYCTQLLIAAGQHRRPMMQVIDEAARYAPQMISKGSSAADCLAAIEVLVEEGRNAAIGVTLLTQRSARMAKSVSELAEVMVAFRIVGPNSVEAVLDWFGDHVQKSQWTGYVEQLRKLPVGQALVVSPGWLEYEGLASFRRRQTFDSSKTPTGTEKALAQRVKPGDLDKLRAAILATVEKAELQDPTKLQRKLAATQQELEATKTRLQQTVEASAGLMKPKTLTAKPALSDNDRAVMEKLSKQLASMAESWAEAFLKPFAEAQKQLEAAVAAPSFQNALKRLTEAMAFHGVEFQTAHLSRTNNWQAVRRVHELPDVKTGFTPPTAPAQPRVEVFGKVDRDLGVSKPELDVLRVLAAAGHEGCTVGRLTLLSGKKYSGGFRNILASLRTAGMMEGQNTGVMRITQAGLDVTGPVELPRGSELARQWLQHPSLGQSEREVLALLLKHRAGLTAGQLTDMTGKAWSGGFRNTLAKLRTAGVMEGRNAETMTAKPELFD